MKTTIELPDSLFRQAKALAASRGTSLKALFTEALTEKVSAISGHAPGVAEEATPWMAGFGKLDHLAKESDRISGLIAEEFETIDATDIE
jgi:predicted transcriptional regulator